MNFNVEPFSLAEDTEKTFHVPMEILSQYVFGKVREHMGDQSSQAHSGLETYSKALSVTVQFLEHKTIDEEILINHKWISDLAIQARKDFFRFYFHL